jgi:hypothetical protein
MGSAASAARPLQYYAALRLAVRYGWLGAAAAAAAVAGCVLILLRGAAACGPHGATHVGAASVAPHVASVGKFGPHVASFGPHVASFLRIFPGCTVQRALAEHGGCTNFRPRTAMSREKPLFENPFRDLSGYTFSYLDRSRKGFSNKGFSIFKTPESNI